MDLLIVEERSSSFKFQDSSVRHAHEEKPAALQTCAQRTLPLTPNPQSLVPNSGFTLLEVLVAMAVLAVALVSLLGLYNRSLLLTIRAQRLSTATLLAEEMLTRTQIEGMGAMHATAGDFADLHPGQYSGFRWYRTMRPTALEGLWELRVGVSWGEREDETETCELTLFTPLS